MTTTEQTNNVPESNNVRGAGQTNNVRSADTNSVPATNRARATNAVPATNSASATNAVPAANSVPQTNDVPGTNTVRSVITLREVAARVGGRTLWNGVDLDIAPGEFVAILGPNGVGKSTLIKIVLGLLPAAAGTVTVLGHQPGQHNQLVGYLPQRRSFDPSLRIRGVDVVRLGLDGDRWGLPLGFGRARRRAERERVAEVIDLVGASAYAHRPIGQLSGGEQQRLLIAQALVRRPSVLLLDEPLDSLDLPNQSGVAALVSQICRQEGVSVLMVAHDVNPILSYLDRVVYFAHGAAVSGTPAEVITSNTLSALYGAPVEVLTTSDGRLVVVGTPEAPAVHADRHGSADAAG